MSYQSIQRLQYLCDRIPSLLHHVSEEAFCFKPGPEKWSKKEILGHLIDSATNNHQRFIRAQYEDIPTVVYNQNQWNALSHYNEINTLQLVQFWTLYNCHLLHIIQNISTDNLKKLCSSGEQETVTLEWLVDDYVRHMEHHLHQIVEYR